jgi:putative pyruvate formate lyase activating enzyme
MAGGTGYCGQTAETFAARAALHFWEEPCISGTSGSGTVFFSGCSLRCIYCQNREIALGNQGQVISLERLSQIFLELQEKGANNINLVTPTHYVPQIRLALIAAKKQGLTLPIVYNTGGYEEVETLRMLDGLIGIYLPDLKYRSSAPAARFSNCPDYFEKASLALQEMYRQVGDPVFDASTGLMRRGMIVRHLLLPGQVGESKRVLRWLHDTFGDHVYVSIMNQYTPMPQIAADPAFEDINRRVTDEEYERLLSFAEMIGIERGFLQEGETAKESFIPPFTGEGL